MKWYLFCRSGLILCISILLWLFVNLFINVPPDFVKCYGNVIHKELVKSVQNNHNTYHTYNFTYLNKSGKVCNENNVEFKEGSSYYDEFIKNDKYYDVDCINLVIFVLLCAWGFLGTLITTLCENDMNEYFDNSKDSRIKGRNMRIKHFKIFVDFWGYDDEQEKEDTYAAIEMFKENDSEYKHFLRYGGVLKIPKWNYMYDEIWKFYNQIVKERKQKETNITNGEVNEGKHGGFCD